MTKKLKFQRWVWQCHAIKKSHNPLNPKFNTTVENSGLIFFYKQSWNIPLRQSFQKRQLENFYQAYEFWLLSIFEQRIICESFPPLNICCTQLTLTYYTCLLKNWKDYNENSHFNLTSYTFSSSLLNQATLKLVALSGTSSNTRQT